MSESTAGCLAVSQPLYTETGCQCSGHKLSMCSLEAIADKNVSLKTGPALLSHGGNGPGSDSSEDQTSTTQYYLCQNLQCLHFAVELAPIHGDGLPVKWSQTKYMLSLWRHWAWCWLCSSFPMLFSGNMTPFLIHQLGIRKGHIAFQGHGSHLCDLSYAIRALTLRQTTYGFKNWCVYRSRQELT